MWCSHFHVSIVSPLVPGGSLTSMGAIQFCQLQNHPREVLSNSNSLNYFSLLMKSQSTYLELLWCQLNMRGCFWHIHICCSFEPQNIAVRQVAPSLLHGRKVAGSEPMPLFKIHTAGKGRTRNLIQSFWFQAIF